MHILFSVETVREIKREEKETEEGGDKDDEQKTTQDSLSLSLPLPRDKHMCTNGELTLALYTHTAMNISRTLVCM